MNKQKLTQEEVTKLKDFQSQYSNSIVDLGYIEYQLKIVTEQKEAVMVNLNKIDLEQKDYLKTLEDKYGTGTINLETGELIKS